MGAARREILRKAQQQLGSASELAEAIRRCKSLEECQLLHDRVGDCRLEKQAFPANLLIKLYSDLGRLDKARGVFASLLHRNLYSWTIMFSALARNGHPQEALQLFDSREFEPDLLAFTMAFQACSSVGSLSEARSLYTRFASTGLHLDSCGENAVVQMFAECGGLGDARGFFESMSSKSVITWNIILGAHANEGEFPEVIHLLQRMDLEGDHPDSVTFLIILGGCSDLKQGRKIHSRASASGFNSTMMQTACLHMYSRCGSLRDAEEIFNQMPQKDLVAFNAMIGVLSNSGDEPQTLLLFRRVALEGYTPNSFTYVGVLTSCSNLELGRRIHARIIESGAGINYILENVLLNMYSRCGSLADAKKIFDSAPGTREISSWNAMIAAYTLHNRHRDAIETFHRMVPEPNPVTFTSVIASCSILGDLVEARRIHSRMMECGVNLETLIQNSLVKLYASCGSLEDAEKIFESITRKDSSSWNSMIAALVERGSSLEGLRLLRRMDSEGVKPDSITFLMLISACAASGPGSLLESRKIHSRLAETIPNPSSKLRNSLINMYARCGSLKSAAKIFEELPLKNRSSWNTIMAGFAQHGFADETLEYFHGMELHGEVPCGITMTIVLVACSHAGLQEEAWYHFRVTSGDYRVHLGPLHYHCMVDLLGRVGLLDEAEEFLGSIPFEARDEGWRNFLGACKTHGDESLGALAARELVSIDSSDASPYVLLSGIAKFLGSV